MWQPLYCFHFYFRYVTLDIICNPMHNRNNEFILIIYIVRRKMADFKCRELEIGLEFEHLSFAECNNFSKGSSGPKKYAQVI